MSEPLHTMDELQHMRELAARGDVDSALKLACSECEDGGWIMYGIGVGDPHFRPCDACGNPKGLLSP